MSLNRPLGGTWPLGDRVVNRMGLGAMRLTGDGVFHTGQPSDRNRAIATLRHAAALGVNHIDTASFYFSQLRSANELINSALAPYPDDLVIATKVGPRRDPSGEWLPPAPPDELCGLVEGNIRELGLEVLDLVYLRIIDDDAMTAQFEALAELRERGLIRNLGLSGVNVDQLSAAQTIAPVVSVQNRYAIGLRDAVGDAVFTACAEQGIAFVPFFSVAGPGRHAGHLPDDEPETLVEIAREHHATPAQIRLAWTLALSENVLVIPGTGNPDHVAENVAAAALHLSNDELERLARVR